VLAEGLDRADASLEVIGNTAYVVTLTGRQSLPSARPVESGQQLVHPFPCACPPWQVRSIGVGRAARFTVQFDC
jgi:hypothetical protein